MELAEEPRGLESQPEASSLDAEFVSGEGAEFHELRPVDRGRDAWTVLIAGVIVEALFWGASKPPMPASS
jgi:hypothetical protein